MPLLDCQRMDVFPGGSRFPVFLVWLLLPLLACGEMPRHKDSRYEAIDAAEGARRLQAFRNQRLEGDYCFRFELEHLPRRGATVRYQGTMWGSWNVRGPVTRFELNGGPGIGEGMTRSWILQNGPEPMAWSRDADGGPFLPLEGDALFTPLLPGVVHAPFDFLMPFLYWSDYRYEGADRIRSRIARNFLMYPPSGSLVPEWLDSVRIGIDDAYNALLNIEVLEASGRTRSSFTVESFKQVQGQWIVKRIVMKDWRSRDRTRFKVLSASLGLALPDAVFSPVDAMETPSLSEAMFEDL